MNIQYEVHFKDNNLINGRIKCSVGDKAYLIKRKITQLQNLTYDDYLLQNMDLNDEITVESKAFIVLRQKIKHKSLLKPRKMSSQSNLYQQFSEVVEGGQEFLQEQIQKPPQVKGRVKQCYKIFSCLSSQKYLVMNSNTLALYNNSNTKQEGRKISLNNIQNIKSYRKSGEFYLRIKTVSDTIDLRFVNSETCSEWMRYITKSMEYYKYIQTKKAYCRPQSIALFLSSQQKIQQQQQRLIILQDKKKQQHDIAETLLQNNTQQVYNKANFNVIKLQDFTITNQIGSGAFSQVYKATTKGKTLALKQLSKMKLISKNNLKYAIGELKILKKCKQSPFIVKLYYSFQTCQYLYLALQYTPYGTLKEYLQIHKTVPLPQAIKIIAELVVAIQYLHSKRILYRDLKPDNLLLTEKGHIMLTDFGLSKELLQGQKEAQSFVGTPLYLAPERFEGDKGINEKADVYGVGAIFYEIIHGKPPFPGNSIHEVIYNIRSHEIQFNQTLPNEVKHFLMSTLHRLPEKRIHPMSDHPIFKNIKWKQLHNRENKLKLTRKLQHQIHYEIDQDYNEMNYSQKRVMGWQYSIQDQ